MAPPLSKTKILQGSFYTAIYRLDRRGWIKGSKNAIDTSLMDFNPSLA